MPNDKSMETDSGEGIWLEKNLNSHTGNFIHIFLSLLAISVMVGPVSTSNRKELARGRQSGRLLWIPSGLVYSPAPVPPLVFPT
jgi:hypothetical protein